MKIISVDDKFEIIGYKNKVYTRYKHHSGKIMWNIFTYSDIGNMGMAIDFSAGHTRKERELEKQYKRLIKVRRIINGTNIS